ncbi:MAG: chromosome segregation protein SMC [Bacteroidota bacterium]|nr:chromosome segregation protein SMC [Bacteroidota bacterium]
MQLSRLEVKGFKSFGDKTVINFDNGITGIVGPNGCGKSNVVDAIRWVLGEQKTRNLRSEKMEDVIFNGTKDRKPHQMAEVSVTFNNTRNLLPTEYSQVTITRRYFRSGDSEYELNGVTCRLKDINSLFLDTGIGSDSYAIIELKMVEDILNNRDGSRRELFEEAAGVSKFKIRKKQTLKKLEDTDKDLSRIEDLLFEIEKNLKSLEKQAKQAEKYFELKEEYKKVSVHMAHAILKNQSSEMERLKQLEQDETLKKNDFIAAIALSEANLEKCKKVILEKEIILKESQQSLNNHMVKIRNYESEKKIKNERLKYLTDTQERLIRQLQSDKELKDKSEILLKNIQSDKDKLQLQLNEQEVLVEKLKSEHEDQKVKTNTLQQQLNELNTNFRSKQEKVFNLSKSLEMSQFQIKSLQDEFEKTIHDNTSQSTELAAFEEKIKHLALQIGEKELELVHLENLEKENEEKIDTLEKETQQLKDKIAETGRKTDSKQNEFNLTKSLVENLEGFPEAVRFLKLNANWVKDVPLLSDVLTSDEKYRIALENYLEPFMNYYIVANESDAIKAVNLLSDASKGKANFFVLSNFEKFASPASKPYSNCTHAISLLEYDPKYQGLIYYLLGNVYVITENQEVIPSDDESIFITQNGKIIKRKFSISGGSVGLFEGKRIGRTKNLEILEKEIKRMNEALSVLKTNLANQLELLQKHKNQSQKTKIEILQKEFNQIKNEYIAYSTKKEQLFSLLNKNTDRKEEINTRIAALEEEIVKNTPIIEAAKGEIIADEQSLISIKELLEEESKVLNTKSATFNEQNILLYQFRNKLNSIIQDLEYKQQSLESTNERIIKSSTELQKIEEDTKQVLQGADMHDEELQKLYSDKDILEKSLNENERAYYATRGESDNIEKQSKELLRNKEISETVLLEIMNKQNEAKLKLNSVKERLSVEFNIDLDVLKINPEEIEQEKSEEELRTKIEQLKGAMDRIGQVNPMAMDAYKEITERYNLINQQKKDITDAKNSLLSTISEIDSTAKENFLTTFVLIKQHFIDVFRSLFTNDDTCDLILVNPDDPLESDIDILAKPKGKRPQSINQLSGGEKTLTAVALLFAIYLIKPAPFCIFDEVDAPLDDANIDKFNNIIKKFSADSQFIIVTHNKRTMASTDIIYGVTMIETGISRVVPVDLRSLN